MRIWFNEIRKNKIKMGDYVKEYLRISILNLVTNIKYKYTRE